MLVFRSFADITDPVRLWKTSRSVTDPDRAGAFPLDDTLVLTVWVKRQLAADGVYLRLYRDDDARVDYFPMVKNGSRGAYLRYDFTFHPEVHCIKDGGLFYYTFAIDTPYGRLFVEDNGVSAPTLTKNEGGVRCFQLLIYQPEHNPSHLAGGIMYHIFVDRFCPGGEVPIKGTAILNPDWENGMPQFAEIPGGFIANNMFFGGTLWGVIEKLDTLKELGVTLLYLSPIFDAYSNHKYDTGDYERVDEMFGGEAALRALCEAAKGHGMGVILDGVFNHTGADSKYFNRDGHYPGVGAYQSKNSPYYSWFDFEDHPDKYRSWWGIPILPAVNSHKKEWIDYISGPNGVLARYAAFGIAGWRLDVVDELSDDFVDALAARVKAEDPDAVIYGEVWEDASNKIAYDHRRRYFRGGQLDSVMDYPLRTGIIRFIRDGDSAFLAQTVHNLWYHYPKHTSHLLMNMLGTHDTERILTLLSGADVAGMTPTEQSTFRLAPVARAEAIERLKQAYLLISFLPGIPCIYYGDEAGMEGGKDPFNRMPYPWGREDKSLLTWYRTVGQLRRSLPMLASADLRILEYKDGVFAFERFAGDRVLLVVCNRTDKIYTVPFLGASQTIFPQESKNSGNVEVLPRTGIVLEYRTGRGAAIYAATDETFFLQS